MFATDVWVGLDYGESTIAVCAVDKTGRAILQTQVRCDARLLIDTLHAGRWQRLQSVVIEGAAPAFFTRKLRQSGLPIAVVDAGKARKLLSLNRNKTDANDARGLANIGRLGAAPFMSTFLRSEECCSIRDQLVVRSGMLWQAATLRGRIRALLRRRGSSLRRVPKGLKLRSTVETELDMLPSRDAADLRALLLPMVAVYEEIARFVRACDKQLRRAAEEIPVTRNFMAIPGVGYLAALAFYAVVEDPGRFTRTEDVASYLGLVPRTKQSGDITRRSRISKSGDQLTRGSLVMCAWVLLTRAKGDCALKDWGRSLEKRLGHYSARVALARKLSVVMLSMWKHDRCFEAYPSPPRKPADAQCGPA